MRSARSVREPEGLSSEAIILVRLAGACAAGGAGVPVNILDSMPLHTALDKCSSAHMVLGSVAMVAAGRAGGTGHFKSGLVLIVDRD